MELSGQAEALGRNRLGRGNADVAGLVLGDSAPVGGQQVGQDNGTTKTMLVSVLTRRMVPSQPELVVGSALDP